MFHKISIYSLYNHYNTSQVDTIQSSGEKNACVDNTEYEIQNNKSTLKALDKEIDILFELEQTFTSQGYYTEQEADYYNDLAYGENYFITGDTISRVSEVTTYNNKTIPGLNFSNNGFFTGVLSINDQYIHYVFNATLNGNLPAEKTGVEYYTFFESGFSFLKYYPANIQKTVENNFYYKEDNTFSEYYDFKINNSPFIDRGNLLNPSYLHEVLSEINSLDDIQFSIFNI